MPAQLKTFIVDAYTGWVGRKFEIRLSGRRTPRRPECITHFFEVLWEISMNWTKDYED